MANRNSGPKSEPKPYFTNYTVATTPDGEVNALVLRALYEQEQDYIRTGRSLRRMSRTGANPTTIRCGYPTKREPDPERIRKRGVPHSNFLKRFKIVDRVTYVAGEFVYSAKVKVLHVTRGWKVYA